jgi:Fic family protein
MYELGQCHGIIDAISRSPLLPEYHAKLLELSLTKGAQATTAIEGNTLSLDEVRKVYKKESLPPSKEYQEKEVRNILDGFNLILREAVAGKDDPITPDMLLRFHKIIGGGLGENFHAVPGEFASSQRVVGPYRAPDKSDVPELVERLCAWLREEFRYGREQTLAGAIVQAIVTHVYIEWIHPFDDGNGRTGRLVEFYVLVRAGGPDIASHLLSNHYNDTRPEYYRLLDKANRERDLTCFLQYAIKGFRDGLENTLQSVQANLLKMSWMKLVHDRFAARKMTNRNTFSRQRALMLELPPRPLALHEIPLITPAIGALYGSMSERTLQRDLVALRDMDLVVENEAGCWRPKLELLGRGVARRRTADAEGEE